MNSVTRASVMVVLGTRPEAIKLCPLVHALDATETLRPVVVTTGQHAAMLDQVLNLFGVTPDVALGLHRPGQTLADVLTRCVEGVSQVMEAQRPDAVVVQGDTTTTLAGALSAYYLQVPVVHLEAGLRSDDRKQPFPEEANRRLVTTLTDLHLAATEQNRRRLLMEGIPAGDIVVTGNTVIDALLSATRWNRPWDEPVLHALDGETRPVVLVTVHRRENWGTPLRAIAAELAELARSRPDLLIVWPMHANPAVQESITPAFAGVDNAILTGPVGYADFSALLERCAVVVTDSGGVQEEAPALGKPVLVLRNVTERQEAVDCGAAVLLGTDPARIRPSVEYALHRTGQVRLSPYGDGNASVRVVAAIEALLGVGERLPDFDWQVRHNDAFSALGGTAAERLPIAG